MAEVLDVFSQVAEEEDVLITNLASNLNLLHVSLSSESVLAWEAYIGTVTGSDNQTAVQAELHVTCT